MPVLTAGAGLHETLALLTSQLRPDANHKEDMVFLKDVFSERSLGYLMKIHEKLRQYERQSPTPVLHSASSLAEDVAEELQSGPMSTEEKELLHLLTSPHLKAVLSVHDTVAQKNFDPVLPPLPDDFEDELEEESVKIVRLVKNKEPLLTTIRRDEATGAVIVARIMRGGAADQVAVYMVLFDYILLEDKAMPCQEAGLPSTGRHLQVRPRRPHVVAGQTLWKTATCGPDSSRPNSSRRDEVKSRICAPDDSPTRC
ncbi:MAGUK p55 subfamily member 3 isoform X1 [Lates japonicus]|uniref:MAGUK p55 subfamily member 3 isoform X1 n=1 Tax=Lates japonicus TaxID=270547 RepID=A0AAD3M8A7_LATJO|nr:MAGUK p55 subfamily member 3 isoform X1 [Lates japonicus]